MACRSLIYIVDASKDVIQIIQEGSVPKVEVATTLTYTGDALAQVSTPVALAATLVDEENQPVSGADISFQVAAQSCSALTGADGVASCDVTIGTAGVYEVTAEFVGDVSHKLSTATALLTVYNSEGGCVTGGGWIASPEGDIHG